MMNGRNILLGGILRALKSVNASVTLKGQVSVGHNILSIHSLFHDLIPALEYFIVVDHIPVASVRIILAEIGLHL